MLILGWKSSSSLEILKFQSLRKPEKASLTTEVSLVKQELNLVLLPLETLLLKGKVLGMNQLLS